MRRACRSSISHQAGFSLVELSIVVVILSTIAVLGLGSAAAYLGHTAYATTQARLAVIDNAIRNYRKIYGYLPCPVTRTVAITSSAYGKETRDGSGNCTNGANITSSSPALRYGMVPVRDLNLPLSYAVDAYGSKFNYIVTTNLTWSTSYGASGDGIIVRSGKLEASCTTLCTTMGTAAYFVSSPGYDRRGGISPRGTVNANCIASTSYDTTIDAKNCIYLGSTVAIGVGSIPVNVFYDSRYNRGTVESSHFDDLVAWRSKSDL
jgi:prepilin-type N-terminal cleavage/methylation domain-containing protein